MKTKAFIVVPNGHKARWRARHTFSPPNTWDCVKWVRMSDLERYRKCRRLMSERCGWKQFPKLFDYIGALTHGVIFLTNAWFSSLHPLMTSSCLPVNDNHMGSTRNVFHNHSSSRSRPLLTVLLQRNVNDSFNSRFHHDRHPFQRCSLCAALHDMSESMYRPELWVLQCVQFRSVHFLSPCPDRQARRWFNLRFSCPPRPLWLVSHTSFSSLRPVFQEVLFDLQKIHYQRNFYTKICILKACKK